MAGDTLKTISLIDTAKRIEVELKEKVEDLEKQRFSSYQPLKKLCTYENFPWEGFLKNYTIDVTSLAVKVRDSFLDLEDKFSKRQRSALQELSTPNWVLNFAGVFTSCCNKIDEEISALKSPDPDLFSWARRSYRDTTANTAVYNYIFKNSRALAEMKSWLELELIKYQLELQVYINGFDIAQRRLLQYYYWADVIQHITHRVVPLILFLVFVALQYFLGSMFLTPLLPILVIAAKKFNDSQIDFVPYGELFSKLVYFYLHKIEADLYGFEVLCKRLKPNYTLVSGSQVQDTITYLRNSIGNFISTQPIKIQETKHEDKPQVSQEPN